MFLKLAYFLSKLRFLGIYLPQPKWKTCSLFLSNSLRRKLKHASIEKEAVKKRWSIGDTFLLEDTSSWKLTRDRWLTCSTSIIEGRERTILALAIGLSCFSFYIVYRPGRDSIPADTLSRATCAMATEDSFFKLHEALCQPGVTRLNHFVRTKNLPYCVDEIKKMTSRFPVFCECRPQFHRREKVPLIKHTTIREDQFQRPSSYE